MRASPLHRYDDLVGSGEILPDPHQARVVLALDELCRALHAPTPTSFWRHRRRRGAESVSGMYLWGGVGRGKTWLMDLFYDCLGEVPRQRIHFHRFMQRIHAALKELGNSRDPLPQMALNWSREYRVLCLDEFFVTDIADAMLLAGLLEELLRNGVTLITTSNLPPDELYRDGLQRGKFLPAIELLKSHCRVLELEGQTDFRLRILEQSEIFHWPLDRQADANLAEAYRRIAAGCELPAQLDINDRPFRAERSGDGVIWFEFDELCRKPRGSADFIEIARAFNTVLIARAPQLDDGEANAARRFIILVDEFYDRGVKLLMSAAVPIEALYTGKRLRFDFQRTVSRLTEMQTREYLSRPHRP